MCRPERHRQGPKREGQWLGPRAVSRAMRGTYSAVVAHQLAVCWDPNLHGHLHLALAPVPCSIPMCRPERHRQGPQNAWVSGGRAPSLAHLGTCIGTCIGKRNGEESARGRRADGSLVGGQVGRITQASERSGSDGAARVTMRRTSGCTGTARQATSQ